MFRKYFQIPQQIYISYKTPRFLLAPNTLSYYEGFINQFTIRGSNYNILSGKILGIPAYGSGNFNITLGMFTLGIKILKMLLYMWEFITYVLLLVGVTIKIFPQLTTYLNDDLIYLNVPLGPIQTNVTRAYYYFENIQSPTNGD